MRLHTFPVNPRPRRRRGFSLMMVTAVVAVAAVIGMAVLSSNTLQAKASTGRAVVLQADSLAESGFNRAVYYVYNVTDSSKCPFNLAVGGSYREDDTSLGGAVKGTFDLVVERRSQNRYWAKSTGEVPSPDGSVMRKSVSAFIDVNYTDHAVAAGADLTIPAGMTVIGDVYCEGNLVNNGTVEGTLYAKTVSGNGTQSDSGLLGDVVGVVGGLVKSLAGVVDILLGPSDPPINHYTTYTYQGKTYMSKPILVGSLANTTLGPTADNPAGVHVRNGTLDLNGNVRINGTLVVMGNLRVQGNNNVITPVETFPALMLDDDLMYKQPNSHLEVNGLMYFGGQLVRGSGSVINSSLKVTGAVYNPGHGATTFDPVFGTINVKFDRIRASVKGWNTDYPNPPPASVSVIGWKTE